MRHVGGGTTSHTPGPPGKAGSPIHVPALIGPGLQKQARSLMQALPEAPTYRAYLPV